jgi:hypothetical protein
VERPAHTAEEQQQYVELALRLIEKVDETTRMAVDGILRRHPDAPAEIFERLGRPRSAFAIDPERDPHQEPGRLATDAPETGLPAPAEAAPAAIAPATPRLAPEPSALGEAFFTASAAERRRLLSLIATDGDTPNIPIEPDNDERIYGRLDAAAMQGRIGEFTREFERLLALPKSLCERILNDRSGEPMVVVAKAVGIPIAVLQRILLLVNPAVSHSVQRVYDLTDLFHGLDRGAALKLIALWGVQARPNETSAPANPNAGARTTAGLRDTSVASLRSRFGALTERVQGQNVSEQPGPGSVARRGLRSR